MQRAAPEKKPQAFRRRAKTRTKTNNTAIVDEEEPYNLLQLSFSVLVPRRLHISHCLKALDIRATALHSQPTQRERLNSLDLSRASVRPVLISTDVGARGLDIEDVALDVNCDIPTGPEEYTHRVGRTARLRRSGMAVSFVTERREERVQKVEAPIVIKLSSLRGW